MGHVEKFESRVGEVEKSIAAIPEMVKTVAIKTNESSDKLKQVDSWFTLNSASIMVLKNSVETLEKRKDEQPASHPGFLLSPSDGSLSSAEALARQTRFNTTLSLGHLPTIFFSEENGTNMCNSSQYFVILSIKLLTILLLYMRYFYDI